MPGAYTIDEARGLVLSRGWGMVTEGDLLAHALAVGADPRFRPDFRQLADFRETTTIAASAALVRRLTDLNPFGAGARRAFVVGSDLAFGVSRMYEMMRGDSPDELHVFRDIVAAAHWLGIDAELDEVLQMLARAPTLATLPAPT